ncbi:MAG: TRAP transporter large permease [Gammaproteobacteria bacterium]
MEPLSIGLIGLLAMFLLIVLHVPIGIAMALCGVAGVAVLVGWQPAMALFSIEAASSMGNESLAVVAIFLVMGSFANMAGLSRDLYQLAYALIGHRRGGLCTATIFGCAGFGAVCGSSVATTATMARMALPEMRKRGYSLSLASGSIASGGTLGILIPPSVIMVLYGVLTEQFIIALFTAAILPGLLAVLFYVIAVEAKVALDPESAPPGPRLTGSERWQALRSAWRVLLVAAVVSGGIYTGIFTVTEAASVGAALCLFMAFGRMTVTEFVNGLLEAASSTCMIFVIIIGASIFSYFVSLSGAPDALVTGIRDLSLHPLMVIALLVVMYLVLGSIFDTVAAMVITLPFVLPLVTGLGYSPIWWGVVMVMAMEIGMITPPIGINVFVLKNAAQDLTLNQIYRGVTPFLIADVARLAILALVPGLALWLPGQLGWL